jgi:hypothetical protein
VKVFGRLMIQGPTVRLFGGWVGNSTEKYLDSRLYPSVQNRALLMQTSGKGNLEICGEDMAVAVGTYGECRRISCWDHDDKI